MALLGRSHQLVVRMRIMRIIVPRMRTHVAHAMRIANAQRSARVSTSLFQKNKCEYYVRAIDIHMCCKQNYVSLEKYC